MTGKGGRYLIGVVVLLIIVLVISAKKQQKDEAILVGIPDGAAGLLARHVLDNGKGVNAIQGIPFEAHTLYDCCASAAQYAMGSGRLDVAILCPEAARELLEKDSSFEITGAVMVNSDIIITRLHANLNQPQIAISQKRTFQRDMVQKRFGASSRAVPMFHGAVPYAFAKGVVQGAVLDITKAFNLEGKLAPADLDGEDICTYVMVSKKSLRDSSDFHRFLTRYNSAVREMDNVENLLRLMKSYVSENITIGDVTQWKKMNVRFICPSSFPPRG